LPGSQIRKTQLDYILTQAAEFDKRMTQLENNLGLNGNTMPEISDDASFPVFTTLQRLERTMDLIGDASANNLDAALQQIQKLTAEADQLKEARIEASLVRSGSGDGTSPAHSDQEAKINALYGTLPSIDKLSPILPLVLERLHTLRLVHTSAWQADEVLTALEKRQSKQEDEIKRWEKQLVLVEREMGKCTTTMQNNMKVVGDDVKMLEAKLEKLMSGVE
jgi:nuclear migration protein JNM1